MQIICVGDLCCDLIVPYGKMQQALFRGDISKEVTRDLQVRMQCGGSVGNVARHLGRLKAQPVFVTPVSRDSLGAYLTEEMEKMGVNMRWATPSDRSNMYCVAVLDGSGERTMFCFVPPSTVTLTEREVALCAVLSALVVLIFILFYNAYIFI